MTNKSSWSWRVHKRAASNLLLAAVVLLTGLTATLTVPLQAHAAPAHCTHHCPAPSPGTADPAACAAAANQSPPQTLPGCGPGASQLCTVNACDIISKYVSPAATVLSASFGLIAIISIIYAAIQYSGAGGDPQKVAVAKKRLFTTIVAIVAYLFLFGFLQFLIPGGVFQ